MTDPTGESPTSHEGEIMTKEPCHICRRPTPTAQIHTFGACRRCLTRNVAKIKARRAATVKTRFHLTPA
ncbi:hypothetical protein LCGC14_1148770 [marine sediment metagenome]|uniref:Uncharacterized protein n=1 Tax=marine sediment metagenome TaxID=412755 RepID=A0A0F9MJE4_9ZZZZ